MLPWGARVEPGIFPGMITALGMLTAILLAAANCENFL